jgi:excisionase family DNA binding protein
MIVVRISQLAEQLGVHRNTVRNWVRSGKLPARSVAGKRYLVTENDFWNLCQEFGLNRSALKLKFVPNGPFTERDLVVVEEQYRKIGTRSDRLLPTPQWGDVCLTCGSCASTCPLAGVDGLDPRKAIRMAVFGLDDELVDSQWPWKCTLCGKCEDACPMNVEIVSLLQKVRSLRPRDKVPGPLHKGVLMCLEKGNNLGIPQEDFMALLEDMSEEMQEEGFPGFKAPVEVKGANLLVTLNSKEPFAEPDDMKFWWKIFYAAGESWTMPSKHWEGVNWGLFTGDEESMKTIVGRLVENMYRLECRTLLLPECGHAYYATRYGLNRWFKEDLDNFEVLSIFDLLLRYIAEGRIKVDPSIHQEITTYHDPCHYGRKSLKAFGHGYFEEGRWITRQCAPRLVEMYPNREGNYCCGAGGGAWSMPFKEERVFYGRFKARQIQNTKAKLVIAPCHNCRDQIKTSLRKEYDLDIEVKYLWELVADSLIME